MCYHSEVKRMQKIAASLTNQINTFLFVTYTKEDIADIIEEYFPEGAEALSCGTDLIIVLNDFKKLYDIISSEIDEDKFDKIKKATIDHRYNGKFNF